MHIRHSRAAVAIDDAASIINRAANGRAGLVGRTPAPEALPTLWASRAFPVRQGRLIGVRLRAGTIQAALMAPSAEAVRWVDAQSVLSEAQANQWVRTAQFSRSGR